VARAAGERDLVPELSQLAIDARAHEALAPEGLELAPVLALPVAYDGRQDRDAGSLVEREQAVRHLLHGLARDRELADGAAGLADAREEQAQVVRDLGRRPDGGAGIAAHRLLLDRDRRREAVDRIDVGTRHLVEELPRIGGQGLDVAALTLGVDRVEGERGLSGAREARDHDEAVARDADVEVGEVVLPGAAHDDLPGAGDLVAHGVADGSSPAGESAPESLARALCGRDGAARLADCVK